jgi:hypothetical protein
VISLLLNTNPTDVTARSRRDRCSAESGRRGR